MTGQSPPEGSPGAISNPKSLLVDLHIHTALSPCADVEMIPPLIVRRALALGLRLIGITDHNSAANCAAVIEAASGTGLAVLPGMEAQTSEDIHVLCLFDAVEQALAWQAVVWEGLPDRANPESVLGPQYVVDAAGEYVRTEDRLLLTATGLTLDEVATRVAALGGLAIPAHVDRPSFSLLANLGFVPPDLPVPALEISHLTDPVAFRSAHPELGRWPLVRGSDAHRLDEMQAGLRLEMGSATTAGLVLGITNPPTT